MVTDYGISVDNEGQNTIPELLDNLTKQTEDCLKATFPNGSLNQIRASGYCHGKTFHHRANKKCLKVKFPANWHWGENGEQLLQDRAPEHACTEKGLPPGPCFWRAGIQDGHIVVTTPNLKLYKDPLIKFITHCENVWGTSELAECARSE